MTTLLKLKNLLRVARWLMGLCAVLSPILAIGFLVGAFVFADGRSEVQLTLDITSPNLFSLPRDVKAGWEDGGSKTESSARKEPSLISKAASAKFELATNPYAPFLRYREPNPWKRLALYCLGTSEGTSPLALTSLLFFGISSWLLWLLLLDVTPETPFTLTNARRLRDLGLLVLGLDVGQKLSYVFVRMLVPAFQVPGLAEPISHYVHLATENALPSWDIGLMLLIIAAVYRRGVELSQEAELVI